MDNPFVIFAGLMIAVLVPTAAITYFGEKVGCETRWQPRETNYTFTGGCVVRLDDGKWWPQNAVKVFPTP